VSQLFLLMTLGPTASVPFAERARGAGGRVLAVFGRVPLFCDRFHIPAIHPAAPVVPATRRVRPA